MTCDLILSFQILVDGKPISNIEVLYIPKNPVHYRKGSFVPSAFADIHSRVNQQLRSSARNSPNIPEDSEGDISISSVSSRGKKSKKKARRVVISDFETSTEYSSRDTSRGIQSSLLCRVMLSFAGLVVFFIQVKLRGYPPCVIFFV
jgi:hypothetical protein